LAQAQALLLPAAQQQVGADIRLVDFIILTAVFALVAAGCSTSETIDEEEQLSTDTFLTNGLSTSMPNQQFNILTDTLTAKSQKRSSIPNSSVEVRASTSKKYYSVQIGAFRFHSNIDHNEKFLNKHFTQPIITFFSERIKLTRMCIGIFLTKKEAFNFLKKLRKQFPKKYPDAWVALISQ